MYQPKLSSGFKWRPRLGYYTDGVNNRFDKENFEAVSYNWWTYVRKVNGLVVFNDYSYSSTTSNHQSNMRQLLKELKIRIDVEVCQRDSLSKGVILDSLYESLILAEIKLERKGIRKDTRKRLERQRDSAGTQLFKLLSKKVAKPFSKKRQTEIRKELMESESKRLESARKESAERREKRKALSPQLESYSPVGLESNEDRMNQFGSIEIK